MSENRLPGLPGRLLRSLRHRLGRNALGAFLVRHGLVSADTARWSGLEGLNPAWTERTVRLARLIPAGSRVLEFGAGRMVLRNHLPPGCRYTPTDVVAREGLAFVCDLNTRPLPAMGDHDVAVFSGVFEYLVDVPEVVRLVGAMVPIIVTSYATLEADPARTPAARRGLGWVNHYSREEFLAIFRSAGFRLEASDEWGSQSLFRLAR